MASMSEWDVKLKILELELISPTHLIQETELSENERLVINGSFDEYISWCKRCSGLKLPETIDDIENFTVSVREYVDINSSDRLEKELIVLALGVSCLQLFVLINWTGPIGPNENLFSTFSSKQVSDLVLDLLQTDGEHVYHLISSPILLCIAMKIFWQSDVFLHCKTAHWWCMRYISIHQQLLPERSPFLHELFGKALENLKNKNFMDSLTERGHQIQLHLEMGHLLLHYYQYKEADANFQMANAISGISCNLDGALGVRTKFQQKPVAQLRVQITKTKDEMTSCTPLVSNSDIPKALALNDDTLLESVKFNEQNEKVKLSPEESAIVLAMCTSMQKTSPSHRLRDEQIMCVIQYLLSNPMSWSIHTEALRVRCLLERDRSRTVERSMMQLEALVKNVLPKTKDLVDDLSTTSLKRLSLFYSVWPKPSWILQKQLAALFESLGVLSSALEIYTRLHMWEEAIVCLIRTERGHEAERIIREQLKIKEIPNLYCLLGDVLQDPDQYWLAWKISKERSARAMRSLGAYKISKKLYGEAVECFEKSLKVNYMQVGTWFSMGCACLANKDFEKAAKSFQKCLSLNWDNFEAWTNLSTAFVRCNKKLQAYKALTEGLKCNFNRWELWENYLFVSIDTGYFSDAIRAYNRLLDLKGKYLETSVLHILIKAIVEDMDDAYGQPASKLKGKVLELFGRLTSKTTSDWTVWSLYAQLLGDGIVETDEVANDKALHCLQKALRSSLQRQGWEKEIKTATQNVSLGSRLIDACVHLTSSKDSDQSLSLNASTRLTVNGVKAKLKMHEKSLLKEDAKIELQELLTDLDKKLSLLNNCIGTS